MLVYRPQDRTKVMILIPSVIAVLLYFLLGVLPMMAKMRQDASPAPTPVEPTTQQTPPPSTTAPEVAANSTQTAAQPQAPESLLPEDITSDPFKPPIPPPATAVAASAKPNPPIGTSIVGPLPVPNMASAAVRGSGGPVIGPQTAAATQAPAAPEVTLQGVVLADQPVGVFRSGDQTIYKHVGETVAANMVLRLISDSGVVMSRGKQLYALEIGHSDLNPTTSLTPPVSSTMTKSAAQLDKAAMAYSSAGDHTRQPEQPVPTAATTDAQSTSPVAQAAQPQTTQAQTPIAQPTVSVPAVRQTRDVSTEPESHPVRVVTRPTVDEQKIVVTSANLTSDTKHVTSIPTEAIAPEIHQVSMLVHKKLKVRHKRKHSRHARLLHRRKHRAAHHSRPRSHPKSIMARGAD